MNRLSASLFTPPVRDSVQTLGEQIHAMIAQRLTQLDARPGSGMPSIRAMAKHLGVSTFTIVAAYEQLATEGWLRPRQGAGYFVLPQRSVPRDDGALRPHGTAQPGVVPQQLDVAWLLNGLLRDVSADTIAGSSGLLPPHWLDTGLMESAMRATARSSGDALLGYGHPLGHAPLRARLSQQLQAQGIPAHPDQHLLLTAGVTHAVDLVLRALTKPGDSVLVEDPAWFLVFGRLAAAGVKALPVPRTPNGPDVAVMEELARTHRPRLFIINSTVHNPTGYTLSAQSAFQVLQIAQRHDFHIFEDDIYGDLHPGGATRLAALDGLQRVLLAGGFSKTLAAGVRVGYLAAAPDMIESLRDLKLLSGLSTPQTGERIIHHVLSSPRYRKHLVQVRDRVDQARIQTLRQLQRLGMRVDTEPAAGMFIWADCGRDSEELARNAAHAGMLLAPGSLFSPTQAPSTYIRFSVALAEQPNAWKILASLLR